MAWCVSLCPVLSSRQGVGDGFSSCSTQPALPLSVRNVTFPVAVLILWSRNVILVGTSEQWLKQGSHTAASLFNFFNRPPAPGTRHLPLPLASYLLLFWSDSCKICSINTPGFIRPAPINLVIQMTRQRWARSFLWNRLFLLTVNPRGRRPVHLVCAALYIFKDLLAGNKHQSFPQAAAQSGYCLIINLPE